MNYVLIVICILFFSCTSSNFRTHYKNPPNFKKSDHYLLFNPDLHVFELNTSQIEFLPDESIKANYNGARGLNNFFEIKNLSIDIEQIDTLSNSYKELKPILSLLFKNLEHFVFARGGSELPTKKNHFDYSVGDISDILDPKQADYLVFVHGYNTFKSTGKKVEDAIVGALFGVQTIVFTYYSIGIFNRAGELVWVGTDNNIRDKEFTNYAEMYEVTSNLLSKARLR